MRHLHTTSLLIVLLFSYAASAQDYQDCADALDICSKGVLQFGSSSGAGQEIEDGETLCDASLGQIEFASTWITWTVATAGTLEFVLTPEAGFETADLDFFVYRLAAPGFCDDKENVRCMTSGENVGQPFPQWAPCTGATGLIAGETDVAELPGCAGDDNNFLAPLEVEAGEAYALLVNNFSGEGGFTFELCGTAALPCDTSDCTVLSAVEESPAPQRLTVWPNPAQEVLYLSLADMNINEQASDVQLFSLSGRLVREWAVPLSGERRELDLRRIPNGAYLLRVESEGFTTQQLVVVAQ